MKIERHYFNPLLAKSVVKNYLAEENWKTILVPKFEAPSMLPIGNIGLWLQYGIFWISSKCHSKVRLIKSAAKVYNLVSNGMLGLNKSQKSYVTKYSEIPLPLNLASRNIVCNKWFRLITNYVPVLSVVINRIRHCNGCSSLKACNIFSGWKSWCTVDQWHKFPNIIWRCQFQQPIPWHVCGHSTTIRCGHV